MTYPRSALLMISLFVSSVMAQPSSDPSSPAADKDSRRMTAPEAVATLSRELARFSDPDQYGYDLIVGRSNGSALQIVAATLNVTDRLPGVIPYSIYEDLSHAAAPPTGHTDYRRLVRWAVPMIQGDSWKGRPIVGTTPQMFGYDENLAIVKDFPFQYAKGHRYELAEGRVFSPRRFEAVIGAEAAAEGRLKLGDKFRATHGFPAAGEIPDVHAPEWEVVGILKPTHTRHDRALFIPLISFYASEEHVMGLIQMHMLRSGFDWQRQGSPEAIAGFFKANGFDLEHLSMPIKRYFKLAGQADGGELLNDAPKDPNRRAADPLDRQPFTLDPNGDIILDLPKPLWQVSAVLVTARSRLAGEQLRYTLTLSESSLDVISPANAVADSLNAIKELIAVPR